MSSGCAPRFYGGDESAPYRWRTDPFGAAPRGGSSHLRLFQNFGFESQVLFCKQLRLFQNFSFWNSYRELSGKTGFDRFFESLSRNQWGFGTGLTYSTYFD
jgi:hypothetical protein